MSRPCPICISEKRIAVDRMLSEGISYTKIGDANGYDKQQIFRHMKHAQLIVREAPESVARRLQTLCLRALDVLEEGMSQGNGRMTQAIQAAGVLKGYVQLFMDKIDQDRKELESRSAIEDQESDFIRYLHTRPDIADDYAVWLRAQRTIVSSE